MSNADRIKSIQQVLKQSRTGIFDLNTCIAFEKLISMKPILGSILDDHKKAIQKAIGISGKDVDGIFGPITLTRIENYLDNKLPQLSVNASIIASKAGLEQILKYEVSSESNYTKNLSSPNWPGNDSGITIGIGYDLGFTTPTKLREDWNILSEATLKILTEGVGKTGTNAKATLGKSLKSITISLEDAKFVFYTVSLAEYAQKTRNIYPGIEKLPADAQAALLSMVYNRGAKLTGDRKIEMSNIVKWVREHNLPKIAEEIRNMKRLWKNTGQPGLLKRREQEALMVENAHYFIAPEEYVFV